MANVTNVKQALSLPSVDVDRMTDKELRDMMTILASAANKRLKRLGATERGKMSPAYQVAQKRGYNTQQGGKFGVKGLTRNQLRNEYKAVKSFMGMKTSSVTGWKKYRNQIYGKIGGGFKDINKEKQFWKNYRLISKDAVKHGLQGYGSTERQADLRDVMEKGDYRKIMREISDANLSQKHKSRDAYLDDITDKGYIINENHRREKIDVNDNEDALYLMSLKIGVEYAKENPATNADEQFYTVQRNQ